MEIIFIENELISKLILLFFLTLNCLYFFKQNPTKNLYVILIYIGTFQLSELLFSFVVSNIFTISPILLIRFPVLQLVVSILSSFVLFTFSDLFKKFKLYEAFSTKLNFLDKLIVGIFLFSLLFFIFLSTYAIYLLFSRVSSFLLFTLICLNVFLLIILTMLIKTSFSLEKAEYVIDSERKSYDSLSHSYDSMREFKHDFSNIMQSIGGYLYTDDLDGLKIYYSSIFKECSELQKCSTLSKDVLNSPPVLALITEKYYKAKDLGIEFNIEVLLDLTTLNMDIYEFTRVLGIFLDNSIEAASNASQKFINILLTKDINNNFASIVVENSCQDTAIDTSRIFDKDFSTKPKNSGIGLWKVKKILKHYDNILLNTSVNNNLFRHQLKIYY